MVSITKQEKKFTLEILGFHKIWALKRKIIISKENIINVYQDRKELSRNLGWRLGTYIPGIITAGEFSYIKNIDFWDVCNKNNAIILELRNHKYRKIIIQVENPLKMIELLKK